MRDHARSSGLTKLTSLATLALVACHDGSAPTAPQVELPGISADVVPAEGVVVETFATGVQQPFQQGPIALAFDSDGNLYVATGGGPSFNDPLNILKIPAGTNVPQSFGDVAIVDPDGVAVDSQGNIIVSGNPVTKFAPTGTIIWEVSCPIGNIQLVTVDADDNIYVGSLGKLVCKISPGGSILALLGLYKEPSEPAISPDGFLYIAQAGASNIIKVSLDGAFLGEVVKGVFAQPAFSPSADLFVGIGGGAGIVQKISILDGTQTTIASGFSSPRGLAFASDGTLFVADNVSKVIYRIKLPQQQVHALINAVDDLLEAGVLNKGNATALRSSLDKAVERLREGKKAATVTNRLLAFIDKVEDFIAAGKLTSEQGQPLIDAAQDVIDQLST